MHTKADVIDGIAVLQIPEAILVEIQDIALNAQTIVFVTMDSHEQQALLQLQRQAPLQLKFRALLQLQVPIL